MFPPPTPWKAFGEVDPDREYLGFTSRFFLASIRSVPGFVAHSQRIKKQANAAPGVVGWSLAADLLKLEFHTLSVWESESQLRAFVAQAHHNDAMAKFAGSMRRESILVYFPVLGS
jgi:quinol monooxygenase YgiN